MLPFPRPYLSFFGPVSQRTKSKSEVNCQKMYFSLRSQIINQMPFTEWGVGNYVCTKCKCVSSGHLAGFSISDTVPSTLLRTK